MRIIKSVVLFGAAVIVTGSLLSGQASAHVVVSPSEVITASRQTFAVSVPNEHDTPVVAVRLVIPAGLESVRPFAKAGWTVDVTTTGEGEETSATEITWTGGSIPVDLKDEFLFGAKVPSRASELQWNAYETYGDGTVVAWDQAPTGEQGSKPYSVTKVVDETEQQAALNNAQQAAADSDKSADLALYSAGFAAVMSIAAVVLATRRKED